VKKCNNFSTGANSSASGEYVMQLIMCFWGVEKQGILIGYEQS